MKLCVAAIIFLAIFSGPCQSREITHEDIKDAMLSLVHMMRENTEKLERHEVRERQLGEHMKKVIGLLSKRISSVDGFKTHLGKLEERIAGIEQLISQRDARERIQIQKTADRLESLENRLVDWLGDIQTKLADIANAPAATPAPNDKNQNSQASEAIVARLNKSEAAISGQIAGLQLDLDKFSLGMKNESAARNDKLSAISNEVKGIGSRMEDLKAQLKALGEASERAQQAPAKEIVDPSPAIEEQTRTLKNVKELLEESSDRIQQIPIGSELRDLHNETRASLEETKRLLENVLSRGFTGIENGVTRSKEETKDFVSELRSELVDNAERVNRQLRDLEKGQSVMVSMADHVLDTKKRVEYGVHQILLEVGDLVKAQGVNINDTLNLRFDGISNDIMDNQNGAVANLTTKMEQEMNQVWRQINVMYQQMSESAKALDKLHKQNEAYVNGTTTTMGGMESKVGEITKRMSEVDENLNYLLGRLSLVTQEFNQIKSGLGAALDNIKASFREVQEKANDLSNPGPHPVPENYQQLDEDDKSETASESKKPPFMSDIKSY